MPSWTVRRRDDPGNASKPEPAGAPADREFVIEDSLGYLVNRAARAMAQQLADELRPAGVGIGQWAVLMFLWAEDGLTQAELSRVVAIEPPTIVRTIDRLARDGLVERRRDPGDRRLSRIYLTAKGRALRDELVPRAMAVNERNLGRLRADDARRLVTLLERLVEPE